MKKKILVFSIIMLFSYVIYYFLTHSALVLENVLTSIDLWKRIIFPSLFPFFLLTELLIYFGFVDIISLFSRHFIKLFKVSSKASFVLIMSMFSGFPSSARIIKKLYDCGDIDLNTTKKVLVFTHFANPLFILGGISYGILGDIKIGIIILVSHYLSNFVMGIIFRNNLPYTENKTTNSTIKKKDNFIETLSTAIISSINTLFLLLGIIIFFSLILLMIRTTFVLPDNINLILSGLLEITNGINYVSMLNLSNIIKGFIICCFLSFGGLSVHMQVFSILSGIDIKYTYYLKMRTIQVLIAGLLYFIMIMVR